MRLKIVSFNIHKGYNWNKTKITLERLRRSMAASEADIVFLQEIVGENARQTRRQVKGKRPPMTQLEYIADTIWHHGIYEQNAVSSNGHHGNAVLSKFPITSWHNVNISTNRFEKRGLLECRVQIPHKRTEKKVSLHAFCSHLNLAWGRKRQHDAILARLKKIRDTSLPVIIAGDFNDWDRIASGTLESSGLKEAFKEAHGDYALTFPDFFPFLPLDRVYYKNMRLVAARRLDEAKWRRLSDHAALYCEFEVL